MRSTPAPHLHTVLAQLRTVQSALNTGDLDTARMHLNLAIADVGAYTVSAPRTMKQSMALLTSNASPEWYTPAWLIALVHAVLGTIDLDPASCAYANTTVQATRYYAQHDDGLMHPWTGRVWCNPPFNDMRRWSGRARTAWADREYTALVMLCNSAPGYIWYEQLVDAACAAVQLRTRVQFTPETPVTSHRSGAAKKGQTIVYFGHDVARFTTVFASYGRMLAGHTPTQLRSGDLHD